MEEAELEDWFTEEREKLEETLLSAMMENKGQEKAKARFDKQYRELIAKYQREQQSIYDSKRRIDAIQKPIAKSKETLGAWADALEAWWNMRKENVRKWFFERKIRRILKDKSDL